MTKRARLIYNPSSGREEMKKKLPDILQRLERGGLETSTHATIGEGDATLAAADAVERGFDVIIAAGGDGTIKRSGQRDGGEERIVRFWVLCHWAQPMILLVRCRFRANGKPLAISSSNSSHVRLMWARSISDILSILRVGAR